MKEKPVASVREMTKSHVDTQRKLDARLCAQGYTETMLESCSAPTISINTLRSVLGIVPIKKWKFRVIDIARAYLQADNLDRAVFTQPPKGAEVNDKLVWLLKKPVYGLCDSTKRWNNTISVFIESIGGRKSMSDPAMFYWPQHKTNILGAREKCVSWED